MLIAVHVINAMLPRTPSFFKLILNTLDRTNKTLIWNWNPSLNGRTVESDYFIVPLIF